MFSYVYMLESFQDSSHWCKILNWNYSQACSVGYTPGCNKGRWFYQFPTQSQVGEGGEVGCVEAGNKKMEGQKKCKHVAFSSAEGQHKNERLKTFNFTWMDRILCACKTAHWEKLWKGGSVVLTLAAICDACGKPSSCFRNLCLRNKDILGILNSQCSY